MVRRFHVSGAVHQLSQLRARLPGNARRDQKILHIGVVLAAHGHQAEADGAARQAADLFGIQKRKSGADLFDGFQHKIIRAARRPAGGT